MTGPSEVVGRPTEPELGDPDPVRATPAGPSDTLDETPDGGASADLAPDGGDTSPEAAARPPGVSTGPTGRRRHPERRTVPAVGGVWRRARPERNPESSGSHDRLTVRLLLLVAVLLAVAVVVAVAVAASVLLG